jgi:hypothetical protein
MHQYNPYNARSDLLVISLINFIKDLAKQSTVNDRVIKYEFITLDKALKSFLLMIEYEDNGIKYLDGIFPELNFDESINLLNELKDN